MDGGGGQMHDFLGRDEFVLLETEVTESGHHNVWVQSQGQPELLFFTQCLCCVPDPKVRP